MERNQAIAIVVIIIIVGGAAVGFYLLAPPPGPGPVDTGVIIMGTTDSVESSLDIAQSYDYFGWEVIGSLSSGLVEIQPGSSAGTDDINPALATSWTMSGGGTIWDFTLREGVLFEDGTEFTADDVKFTFDRNCNLTGDGLFEEDGPQLNMEYDAIINNVTVTGTYTVRFYLKIAFAPFLQLMAAASSFMVDHNVAKDTLTAYTEGNNRSSHAGALGPYLLESWTRIGGSDEQITLVKNPDYWNATNGLPKTPKIIIKMFESSTALAAAMAAGEIDIAYRHLTSDQEASFRENPNLKYWSGIGAAIQYMCFQQQIAPFDNPDVRRAITASVNRTHVTETVFLGEKDPLYSMIPMGMAFHKPSFEIHGDANYTYARSLLEPLGYNETHPLTIDLWYEASGHYPSSHEQALVYQADLEASGVMEVRLFGTEWPTFRLQRNAGTMPVFIYGWYPDFIDPDNYAFLPFASWLNLGYNKTYPAGGVAQYDLFTQGREGATDAARQTAYYALQDLQASECSVIPLWQGFTTAVTNLNVEGIILDITVSWRHWLVYLTE
ncbi:MAG: hypothetical protein JSW05_08280 [Candidatus Thorarchaeota archaeon]|nr:MAG: hypothetical protein JSW05_08280 [Candidatus Thorarchaeota archaeon]